MKIKKAIFICIGCVMLGIGAVGAVIPLLPSFPFLLVAAICFANSSEKLHNWFIHTKLYKKNLESYVKGKGMTKKAKLRIITVVTLTMAFGFIMMSKVPVGRIILAVVWLCHIIYFIFGVKTISDEEDAEFVKKDQEEIERKMNALQKEIEEDLKIAEEEQKEAE